MSQRISTKSGQKGADTQKSIIEHKEYTESQPIFPPLYVKEAKDQSKELTTYPKKTDKKKNNNIKKEESKMNFCFSNMSGIPNQKTD